MIGSLLTRGLVMVFGYAYPAYECYKSVEKNKPEIEQLRFWCQYWILVAVLTVCERVGDAFISWVPMYSEAKLAFFIYLWYPKTKGTTYVYDSFFKLYVAKHETDIDRSLLELRTRAGDIAVLYWQKAASHGQTRIYEILQYVAAQSAPPPRPDKPRGIGVRPPPVKRQADALKQPLPEELLSPSSKSSSQHQKEVSEEKEVGPSQVSTVMPPAPVSSTLKVHAASETTNQSASGEVVEPKEIEASTSLPAENGNGNPPPPTETLMEETLRVTRVRLRKARSAGTR